MTYIYYHDYENSLETEFNLNFIYFLRYINFCTFNEDLLYLPKNDDLLLFLCIYYHFYLIKLYLSSLK